MTISAVKAAVCLKLCVPRPFHPWPLTCENAICLTRSEGLWIICVCLCLHAHTLAKKVDFHWEVFVAWVSKSSRQLSNGRLSPSYICIVLPVNIIPVNVRNVAVITVISCVINHMEPKHVELTDATSQQQKCVNRDSQDGDLLYCA